MGITVQIETMVAAALQDLQTLVALEEMAIHPEEAPVALQEILTIIHPLVMTGEATEDLHRDLRTLTMILMIRIMIPGMISGMTLLMIRMKSIWTTETNTTL